MHTHRSRCKRQRRGGIYIAVLGASMLVTLIGMTALAAMRVERLAASAATDAEQARLYAQSGIELAAAWIAADNAWRTTYTSGIWTSDLHMGPSGDGRLTLTGIDPVDGDLRNRPTDPVLLRASAVRGTARQIVEARLEARSTPLDILALSLYVPGELRIRPGVTLSAWDAPVATGATLRNDGAIAGDAECFVSISTGTISGELTIGLLPRELPDPATLQLYRSLATPINPGTLIDRRVLAPGNNPWGSPSPDGVYIITSDQNLTIRNTRIHGTLVVIAPGRTVTIDSQVLMHAARPDHPVLIVDGDLVLAFSSAGELSEAAINANLNPASAPYEGVSNNTRTDVYPSEIRGLVHVRGTLLVTGTPRLLGAVIVESESVSNAAEIRGNLEVRHDPRLVSNPPMGYARRVEMVIRPGSWRQVVLP
jgi:hypothetical protein